MTTTQKRKATMIEDRIPLYATIPYLGGAWSVTYSARKISEGCFSTCERSGYGPALPADLPAGLPVIDFEGDDLVFLALKIPDSIRPAESNPHAYTGTLAGYLQTLRDIGIKVTAIPVK